MIMRTPQDFGALIRSARKEQGLDQAALATRMGVSRLWVNEVERGKPRAQLGLVLRALSVLGIALRVDAPAPSEVNTPDIDVVVVRVRGEG